MPRAISVSLSRTYPQLAVRSQDSHALCNCTCAWWQITPANAADVRYAFGVFEGRVVSAYRVAIDVSDWPVMPDNAIAAGRRYIPVEHLTPEEWEHALKYTAPRMYGAVRYGVVGLDAQGKIVELGASDAARPCDDEREPDQ